jgi:hypothetical protein
LRFIILNKYRLITFNKNTFFKNTYCEFQEVNHIDIEEKNCYKSKHNSLYFFTKEGVYRKSNHWGRVASCRWKLITTSSYKNQQTVLAFAKWKDFYSLHETEKLFYISVNFETKKTKIKISKSKKSPNLLTLNKAQIKEKQIKHLFKEDKWAQYFNSNIEELRFKIISKLINSDSPLPLIKLNLRLN